MTIALPPIRRFSLTSADPDRLAGFYRDAFGCLPDGGTRRPAASYGVAGGMSVSNLRLGEELIELVRFDEPGRPYPPDSTSHDQWFQHLAIVVADMGAAMAALGRCADWTPISLGGPVTLPAEAGGVTAFKFRDPEGHPLELLQFPSGQAPPRGRRASAAARPCLGIDHSAMACSDIARAEAFLAGLGFRPSGRSLNQGPQQERLDAAPGVVADVVPVAVPDAPGPHLELLGYRTPAIRPGHTGPNDVAATRIVLHGPSNDAGLTEDPDGHRFVASPD
ncbi:VOC family protein [Rhizosaccharibacter radicis]|uniref:Glyoxalase n=1 Tax=Rhizosaccharibacter radicis TaxID=2782605 RepID=A0ABT1VYX4_9PROT|nr:glyoxalase [Acetobacteraceae bacterium KSS12]